MEKYTLYTDKPNSFQCKLELEGASLKNASARVILEGSSRSFLFEGKISPSGQCEISLEKLSEIFSVGESGNMKLEVIADDAYFAPWQSQFSVDASKKLHVEVMQQTATPQKPTMKVSVLTPQQKELMIVTESLAAELKDLGITKANLHKNKKRVSKLAAAYINECVYSHSTEKVITNIVKLLN